MDDHLPIGGFIYDSMDCTTISNKTAFVFTESYKMQQDNDENLQKLEQAASIAKSKAPSKTIVGVIVANNLLHQPFGDIPFTDIMNLYSEQAFALKQGGADMIFIKNITSVSHCRAAILGARQTGLPVILCVKPNGSMELENRGSMTSALIVSQVLGTTGFCIETKSLKKGMNYMEELSPYARIPLFLCSDFSKASAKTLIRMEKYCSPCQNVQKIKEEQLEKIKKIFSKGNQSRFSYKDTESILVCTEFEPFFLDEMFEISKFIDWNYFDEDLLLDLENSGFDVIGVKIASESDIFTFIENAHLFTKPVAFRCNDPLLLETVLMLYTGRGFVDCADCDIKDADILDIARGYGALVR